MAKTKEARACVCCGELEPAVRLNRRRVCETCSERRMILNVRMGTLIGGSDLRVLEHLERALAFHDNGKGE